jgi:membrane associated rhomboid family serine protease
MIPIRDTIPSRNVPIMMLGLVVANGLIFWWERGLSPNQLEMVFHSLGLVPARLSAAGAELYAPGGMLTLFTSQFLHGGWGHVIANMWTLYIFGDNVEDRTGPFRFLLFYLFCGTVAGLTHWLVHPESTLPTVGASGAVAGVLGAYFILYPRAGVVTLIPLLFWPVFIELPAVTFLFVWLVSQVFSGSIATLFPDVSFGIAFWAHVGGFGAGLIGHRLFLRRVGHYGP